jgi:hypothetical protein
MANFVCDLTLSTLNVDNNFGVYGLALENALGANPPPYGVRWFGERYRRMARNPSWFASLLVSDVDLEGYSAKQLWAYASIVSNPTFANGLRAHAIDEARHSKMFANLLFTIFPKLRTEELSHKLDEMAPDLKITEAIRPETDSIERPFEELLNSAILINLHEIKALILEHLLRPTIMAYCSSREQVRVGRLMNRLISDEIRHIRYSAEFIGDAALRGYREHIFDTMADFQRVLNLVTLVEVEKTTNLQTDVC